MSSKSIEEQKKAARNTNELLDHLMRIIKQNDERFSFEWLVGGERATMEIFDKEKKIGYSVNIEPIEHDENVEAVINKRNLRIGGLKMGKEISRDDAVKMANWWAEQIIHPYC